MEVSQPSGRAGPFCRDLAISCKIFFLFENRASPPKRDLTVDHPRSRLGGLEISHVNALKRAGPSITRAC